MRHRIEGTHIVIDNHTRRIDTRANAIVEHQRHTTVNELLKMTIFQRVLCLRDDDTTDLVLVERLTDAHLALILLIALRYHDAIATRRSLSLNATQDRRKIEMRNLRNNHPDNLQRPYTRIAQTLCQDIWKEIMFARIRLNTRALRRTDARTVFQRTRHRRYAHTKLPRNVLHRDGCNLVHDAFSVLPLQS